MQNTKQYLNIEFLKINEKTNKIYNIFTKNFTPLFFDQYTTATNYYMQDSIDLPRINNNNLIVKNYTFNFLSRISTFLSFNEKELDFFKQFGCATVHNHSEISFEKLNKLFTFTFVLHAIQENMVEFDTYPKNVFIVLKEIGQHLQYENKFLNDLINIPLLYSKNYSSSRNIELQDDFKHFLYSMIENIISTDKDFTFAHLFNTNILYSLGLPIFTDAKHSFQFSEDTLKKIHYYNQITTIDAFNSVNLGNEYFTNHLKEVNGFSFNTPSTYLNTLQVIATNQPTQQQNPLNPNSIKETKTINFQKNEKYNLESLVNDFLSDESINNIKLDISKMNKKELKILSLNEQFRNISFPLTQSIFEKNVYNKIEKLKPKYIDIVIKKAIETQLPYITEKRFLSDNIPLTIEYHPEAIFSLIMSETNQSSIISHKEICLEIYKSFLNDNLWEDIFKLGKQIYNPISVGRSKQKTMELFVNNILPHIREIHLEETLFKETAHSSKKKLKI